MFYIRTEHVNMLYVFRFNEDLEMSQERNYVIFRFNEDIMEMSQER